MEVKHDEVTGSYEQRKKAFKAASRTGGKYIPVTRNSRSWFPNAAQGNNRKEVNGRGVNPRTLNIQRAPKQVTVHDIATDEKGAKVPVVAKVKTMGMRKMYHTRPIILPTVVPPTE